MGRTEVAFHADDSSTWIGGPCEKLLDHGSTSVFEGCESELIALRIRPSVKPLSLGALEFPGMESGCTCSYGQYFEQPRSLISMKNKVLNIIRILFGVILIIFGANKFLGFMPMPELSGQAGDFMGALGATGYIFPVVGAVELGVGVLLVLNLFTPLALVVLVPISVNIVLFHVFLDIGGIVPAAVVAGLNALFLIINLSAYLPMLSTGSKSGD